MIQKAIDTDMMSGNKIRMLIFLFFIDTSSKFSIFYWRNTTVLFKDIAKIIWFRITYHRSDNMAFVVSDIK